GSASSLAELQSYTPPHHPRPNVHYTIFEEIGGKCIRHNDTLRTKGRKSAVKDLGLCDQKLIASVQPVFDESLAGLQFGEYVDMLPLNACFLCDFPHRSKIG